MCRYCRLFSVYTLILRLKFQTALNNDQSFVIKTYGNAFGHKYSPDLYYHKTSKIWMVNILYKVRRIVNAHQ